MGGREAGKVPSFPLKLRDVSREGGPVQARAEVPCRGLCSAGGDSWFCGPGDVLENEPSAKHIS